MNRRILSGGYEIDVVGRRDCMWRYHTVDGKVDLAPPVVQVDGEDLILELVDIKLESETRVFSGVREVCVVATVAGAPHLHLTLHFRVTAASRVVRFCYVLRSDRSACLSKADGRDSLSYLGLQLGEQDWFREVRLSEFDELIHSYRLAEEPIRIQDFDNGASFMGPILCAGNDTGSLLVAYEHGSQAPKRFLEYCLRPDRTVELRAVCGNYWSGFDLEAGYETLWFDFALVAGGADQLAATYRDFVRCWMSPNQESRQPYVFYNTWNYQERHKAWGNGRFLEPIRETRMLQEIDIAHRMGVDVFVIDTGWYSKTGDWRVNLDFFPNGLKPIKERLDSYGMKLGLWFSPTLAAVSSSMVARNRESIMSHNGRPYDPRPVWETEESHCICLVSSYWKSFADELIRCVSDLGVSYFKWDAIGQYGCDADNHDHGSRGNSRAERADCYAFEQVRYMSRVVDRLVRACPEAIVDFDITEGGRSVGLAFLASGKYFLINNGPYYSSFDDPVKAPGGGMGSNVFVFPGQARARLCRQPLGYDKWIPSVLFLTHYLPDDPESSQLLNIASMILGQNGIWGDLPALSDAGVERYGRLLGKYKEVREDITRAQPVRYGIVNCSPEIHEKIAEDTGRGTVVCFSNCGDTTYRYVTTNRATEGYFATDGAIVSYNDRGQAVIEFRFAKSGAIIVYFGTA